MSPYVAQANRLQQTLLRALNRNIPYEFDSVFDLQRVLHPLCTLELTWTAFEDQRTLANDAAAFLIEILENLWGRLGFRISYIPHAVPHEHAHMMRHGLKADMAMDVSRIASTATLGDELRYSQFVGLDAFRLLYENANPLPVLNDFSVEIAAGDFDLLHHYLYGVVLFNHPWSLIEKSHVNLSDTAYPWREAADALADSHLRYHFPQASEQDTRMSSESLDVLSKFFHASVYPPFGYPDNDRGSSTARSALEFYFSSEESAKQTLRSAFQTLGSSPNPHLRTLGQVLHFLLGSNADRHQFQQQLLYGGLTLARDFDFLVNHLAPHLSRHRITPPKADSLTLL